MAEFWELVKTYQGYGIAAFVIAVFATPLAMRVAQRFGVMDYPDTFLKPHARPTPYLGGTAICLAWAAAMLGTLWCHTVEWQLALPVLLGGVAISILGLVDDVRGVSPKMRLAVGAAIIAAVLLTTGAGFRLVASFCDPLGVHFPAYVAVPVSVLISLVVVLGACNSANLIDGLDGLCSGVTAIISLGFFLLASLLFGLPFSFFRLSCGFCRLCLFRLPRCLCGLPRGLLGLLLCLDLRLARRHKHRHGSRIAHAVLIDHGEGDFVRAFSAPGMTDLRP